MEAEGDIIKKYIKINLKRKYIQPSYLLAAYGVIFTNKKDDPEPYFYIDFWKTNNIIIKD